MRRMFVSVVVAVSMAGCMATAAAVHKTDNKEFNAELLFTHEGCRIYRFRDGYREIYYADCRGPASTAWSEPCGKGCVRPEMVVTGASDPK
jgi:hypothetical protein